MKEFEFGKLELVFTNFIDKKVRLSCHFGVRLSSTIHHRY